MPNFSGIWSAAQQFQARGQNIWPKPPDAPTNVVGTAGSTQVSVAFCAPACTGKYPAGVSTYTATSTPGGFTASGASSPLVVTGLTNGTAYTFKVKATGSNGLSSFCSAASGSVTPNVVGQQAYTTAGTYTWVAPAGVTKVSVVAVGGGGGGASPNNGGAGGAAALGYKNNYSVTPGNSYTVVVGAAGTGGTTSPTAGGDSYFVSTSVVKGGGGSSGVGTRGSSCYVGDGGGIGLGSSSPGRNGGSGAGGYSGTGGGGSTGGVSGSAGSGGGGGGGGHYLSWPYVYAAGGGGGVGLLGQGCNGAGGGGGSGAFGGGGGGGGSGGANGTTPTASGTGGAGGAYGGAGGAGFAQFNCCGVATSFTAGGNGARGGVRIIWPGCSRSFPSTCTGDK